MNKNAIVPLAEGFEEIEAITVIDTLRRAGIRVVVAGVASMHVKGSRGIIVSADKKLDEAGEDFDAIVLPGGMPGATNLASSKKVNDVILSLYKKGKTIAAICASPSVVLAPLGILKGKTVTGYPGMTEAFGKETAYKNEPVVADAPIITSQGPATALAFSLHIVENLAGKDMAQKLKKAMLVDQA